MSKRIMTLGEKTMSECNCKLCLTYHTWRKMLAKIPDETVRAYFHDQLEILDCVEDALRSGCTRSIFEESEGITRYGE